MPVAGFKRDDVVLTPRGSRAIVTSVKRVNGREQVAVRYEHPVVHGTATFKASALRKLVA